jgi:hypothetical protein
MSKFFDLRDALAASIVAADIGWNADQIVIRRQTDLWNDVATAISASESGCVLHIGIAEGTATEEGALEMDVSIPLTILCLPQTIEGENPEEDLWESLVRHVHDLRLNQDHYSLRFIFKSFSDLEIEADGGTAYLGRQTVFSKRLSL